MRNIVPNILKINTMKNGATDTASMCIKIPAMNINISFFKPNTAFYMFLVNAIITNANQPVTNHCPADNTL